MKHLECTRCGGCCDPETPECVPCTCDPNHPVRSTVNAAYELLEELALPEQIRNPSLVHVKARRLEAELRPLSHLRSSRMAGQ